MVLFTSYNGKAKFVILYRNLIFFEEFSYIGNSETKCLEFKLSNANFDMLLEILLITAVNNIGVLLLSPISFRLKRAQVPSSPGLGAGTLPVPLTALSRRLLAPPPELAR